jgi:hypothetical protein
MTKLEIVQMILRRLSESVGYPIETKGQVYYDGPWIRWTLSSRFSSIQGEGWPDVLDLTDLEAVENVAITPEEVSTMLDLLGPLETFGLLVYTGKRDANGVMSWMGLDDDLRFTIPRGVP